MSEGRRLGGHLTWDWVDRRLRSMREIWVATAGADGPDAVPVWFWWDGDCVYFSTKADSRKARNIDRQPRVVLHNGDGADPIIIKGLAERVEAADELDRVDRAYAQKYVAPDSGEKATVFIMGDFVFRVRPRRLQAWSYANVSLRTDWAFDQRAQA
jgi:nitroimidazol reductase NimA-like FMN-containing flavoprotein (pyridoxamine 5'-phosphate oxidase superfamily)